MAAPVLGRTMILAGLAIGQALSTPAAVIVAQGDALAVLAKELCAAASDTGDELVVVGPHLSWTAAAPRAKHNDLADQLVARVVQQPDISIAVRSQWVILHDAKTSTFHRFHCRSQRSGQLQRQDVPVRLDVSSLGDVAWLTGDGRMFLARSAAWPSAFPVAGDAPAPEKSSGSVLEVTFGSDRKSSHLAWTGSLLVGVGPAHLSILLPSNKSERREGSAAAEPEAAFISAGILYVFRDGCWDMYTGTDLRPSVLGVGCGSKLGGMRYLSIGPDTIRARDAKHQGPLAINRPSMVIAQITGNLRVLSNGLSDLLERAMLPASGQQAATLTAKARTDTPATISEQWDTWLPRQAWSSQRKYESGRRAIEAQSWGALRRDGDWWQGNAMSVSLSETSDFVNVKGRTLEALGRELTPATRFTEEQIRGIIANNIEFRRALEGELVHRGWLPIGALIGGPDSIPQAFDILGSVEREAEQTTSAENAPLLPLLRGCRRAQSGTVVKDLTVLLQRGLRLVSGVENSLARALGDPTSADLTAAEAREVICDGPGRTARAGALTPEAPLRLLVLDLVRVNAQRYGGRLILKRAIADGMAGRRFRVQDDWQWPVSVDGEVLVGVRPLESSGSAWRDEYLRSWLDRVIRHHPSLQKLMLPVPVLRLALPAASIDSNKLPADSGITILSVETSRALARAVTACPASPTTAELRDRAEAQIKLNTRDFATRAVRSLPLLVAENAIDTFAAMFAQPPEGSIWVVPTAAGLVPLEQPTEQDPISRTVEQREHGTFVAALLASTGPLKGLLSRVEAVWVDLQKGPAEHFDSMNRIRGMGAIMNVSQRLKESWWESFRKNVAESDQWKNRVLVVAAARNVKEPAGDGMPLGSGMVNVLGVGVADKDGNPSTDIRYEMSRVDLLAPGDSVVSLDHRGAIVCGSGTSFASAYVSSVAALLAERESHVSAPLFRARLLATADWKPSYKGQVRGGLLNVQRALDHLPDDMLEMMVDEDQRTTQLYQTVLDDLKNGTFSVDGVLAESNPTSINRKRFDVEWPKLIRMHRMGTHDDRPAYRLTYVDDNGDVNIVEDAVLREPNKSLKVIECRNVAAPASQCGALVAGKIVDYVARHRRGLFIRAFGPAR